MINLQFINLKIKKNEVVEESLVRHHQGRLCTIIPCFKSNKEDSRKAGKDYQQRPEYPAETR
jgi:hypothetical protein